MNDLDPEQLMQLAKAGESSALGKLLQHYTSYLTLLARVQLGRRLQGKLDPADLVQETFVQAQRNFAGFQGRTEAEWIAWLRQILGSRIAKLLRRYLGTQRRNVRLEREVLDDLDRSSQGMQVVLAAPGSTPSQQAARREQAVLLAQALERLPEDYREVLILRHLEGMSFPEIAQRLERSLDSVKNLWARGLGRLRHALGEAP